MSVKAPARPKAAQAKAVALVPPPLPKHESYPAGLIEFLTPRFERANSFLVYVLEMLSDSRMTDDSTYAGVEHAIRIANRSLEDIVQNFEEHVPNGTDTNYGTSMYGWVEQLHEVHGVLDILHYSMWDGDACFVVSNQVIEDMLAAVVEMLSTIRGTLYCSPVSKAAA